MAASATPRTDKAVAVAFSGGLDSTALLHATARAAEGTRVVALHVHHGLQLQADAWAQHCERIAAELELGNTRPADAAQVLRRVAAEARHV